MSDTPRTNKEAFFPHDSKYRVCDADFARQLERELNAANDRIKRLEEALTSIGEYWNCNTNERAMEDACWYAIHTAVEALQSKETKL